MRLRPPIGLALFLVADIAKVTMKEVLREILSYYVPLIATLCHSPSYHSR